MIPFLFLLPWLLVFWEVVLEPHCSGHENLMSGQKSFKASLYLLVLVTFSWHGSSSMKRTWSLRTICSSDNPSNPSRTWCNFTFLESELSDFGRMLQMRSRQCLHSYSNKILIQFRITYAFFLSCITLILHRLLLGFLFTIELSLIGKLLVCCRKSCT